MPQARAVGSITEDADGAKVETMSEAELETSCSALA